jgi:curli biogenesis system outer membrane secretion channel CsgG
MAASLGCSPKYVVVNDPVVDGPILVAPNPPRRALRPPPSSYKFRLAVLDFTDQTNAAGDLVRTIPDILTTKLFESKRYDIFDRGQLRNRSPRDVETAINGLRREFKIDGMLVGSITRFSPQDHKMSIDVRLINVYSEAVMYASRLEVNYHGTLEVEVDSADIGKLAESVRDAIPDRDALKGARIHSLNSGEVVITVGEDRNVKKGMAALVIASGDTIADPVTLEELSDQSIIAEVYVTSVELKTCRAMISRPGARRNVRNASQDGSAVLGRDATAPPDQDDEDPHLPWSIRQGDLVRFK